MDRPWFPATPVAPVRAADDAYTPGNEADFARLYESTYPRLVHSVYAVLGDLSAAEDCVQEAMMKAYQAWPRWRADAPAGAWLHRIAINQASDYRRKHVTGFRRVLDRLGTNEVTVDPVDTVMDHELHAALMRMSVKHASTLVMYYLHGYSTEYIGAVLKISARSVRKQLVTALNHLKAELGPGWNSSGGPGLGL